MTKEEATKFFDEVKAQGSSEEDIMGILYLMFQNGDIDIQQLEELVNLNGWEFTDEFKAMDPEQQLTEGLQPADEDEAAEGVSEEEIEDAKEFDGKDEEDSEEDESEEDEEAEDEEEDEDSDEEDEDEKAAKLFGFDK